MKLERCTYKEGGHASLASVSYKGRGMKIYIGCEAAGIFRDRNVRRLLVVWQDFPEGVLVLKPLGERELAAIYGKAEEVQGLVEAKI